MKKLSKLLFILIFYATFAGAFGADVVYDPKVDATLISNFATELLNTGNTVSQLITQVALIKQELARLDNSNWDTAQGKIEELGNKINQVNNLAYNSGKIDDTFRSTFPGYQTTGASYSDQYKNIVNTTQNTLNSILQSMGTNAADFENENHRMEMLQNQSQNANGQTQAIQAASQIASVEVEQLQLIRQTMIAQTNAQTAYYAAQTQKDASAKSAFDQLVNTSDQEVTGKLDQNPVDSKF